MQTDTEETIERILKKGERHDYPNAASYYFDRSVDRRTSDLTVQPELGLLPERGDRNGNDCADCFDVVRPDLIRNE